MWKQKQHVDELEQEILKGQSSGMRQPAQTSPSNPTNPGPTDGDEENLPNSAPEIHHLMVSEEKHKVDLSTWLDRHEDDVTCKVN